MAISPGLCVPAKLAFLTGEFQLGDDYRVALYTSSAVLSPYTEAYTPAGEVKGQGYRPGGLRLSGAKAGIDGVSACLTWDSIAWPNATINARGAMIYNASRGNKAVVVADFGQDVISTNGNWKLPMPPIGADSAVVRIS